MRPESLVVLGGAGVGARKRPSKSQGRWDCHPPPPQTCEPDGGGEGEGQGEGSRLQEAGGWISLTANMGNRGSLGHHSLSIPIMGTRRPVFSPLQYRLPKPHLHLGELEVGEKPTFKGQ